MGEAGVGRKRRPRFYFFDRMLPNGEKSVGNVMVVLKISHERAMYHIVETNNKMLIRFCYQSVTRDVYTVS